LSGNDSKMDQVKHFTSYKLRVTNKQKRIDDVVHRNIITYKLIIQQ
jgi:hypothetical protein